MRTYVWAEENLPISMHVFTSVPCALQGIDNFVLGKFRFQIRQGKLVLLHPFSFHNKYVFVGVDVRTGEVIAHIMELVWRVVVFR